MAATGNEPDIRTINPAAMTTKPSRNARRSPTLFPGPGRPPAYLRPLRSLLVEMKRSLNPLARLSSEGKALRTAAEFDAARSRPEGHMTWGLQNRLSRIIRPTDGRTVMLAADHGYF